jgi:hypothetical protein
MRTASRASRIGVSLALLSLTACARPLPPPLVVVVVPAGPVRHDLTAWRDDDQVCVAIPPYEAVYLRRSCLSMRAVRTLLLSATLADGGAP